MKAEEQFSERLYFIYIKVPFMNHNYNGCTSDDSQFLGRTIHDSTERPDLTAILSVLPDVVFIMSYLLTPRCSDHFRRHYL